MDHKAKDTLLHAIDKTLQDLQRCIGSIEDSVDNEGIVDEIAVDRAESHSYELGQLIQQLAADPLVEAAIDLEREWNIHYPLGSPPPFRRLEGVSDPLAVTFRRFMALARVRGGA